MSGWTKEMYRRIRPLVIPVPSNGAPMPARPSTAVECHRVEIIIIIIVSWSSLFLLLVHQSSAFHSSCLDSRGKKETTIFSSSFSISCRCCSAVCVFFCLFLFAVYVSSLLVARPWPADCVGNVIHRPTDGSSSSFLSLSLLLLLFDVILLLLLWWWSS